MISINLKNFQTQTYIGNQKKNEKLKSAYGLLKIHKEGHPLRPIVSSFNLLTSNSESYILEKISFIEEKLKFSIKSTLEFKKQFTKNSQNIDAEKFKVICWDVKDLFTNIDVDLAIELIIKYIFGNKNKQNIFPHNSENPEMKQEDLRYFLKCLLLKYNCFETLESYYRQIKGLSTGGKLSNLLSNIFLSHFENKILPPYIKNKNILTYCRYVDDAFIIIDKNIYPEVFEKFNNFHNDIKWTCSELENNQSRFLDTTIYLDKSSNLQIKNFAKPDSQSAFMDYKSVCPRRIKYSIISTEVYRMNSCSSTITDLETS